MAAEDISTFQTFVAALGLPMLFLCFPLCLIPCTTPLYMLLFTMVTGTLGLAQFAKYNA